VRAARGVEEQSPPRLVEQQGALAVLLAHRVPRGRAAPPVDCVHVHALAHQRLHRALVAHARAHVQGRPPVIVERVGRGAAEEEEVESVQVASLHRLAQLAGGHRLVPPQAGARGAELARSGVVVASDGHGEGRASVAVAQAGRGAQLEQQSHRFLLVAPRGDVERRALLSVDGVDVDRRRRRLRVEHRAQPLLVALLRRGEHLVELRALLLRDVVEAARDGHVGGRLVAVERARER